MNRDCINFFNEEDEIWIEREWQDICKELMERLIAYRNMLSLTHREIADVMGVQEEEIVKLERNETVPSVGNLIKYAEVLGVKLRFEVLKTEKGIQKLPLPVGISDFRKVSQEYCYVDKTLLIKELLDDKVGVTLFTRPRRFGKSLNMGMLRTFFEKTPEDTSRYFRDKEIWRCGEKYKAHQGKYPVIFMTFKDVKFSKWEEALTYLNFVLTTEFNQHPELRDSDKCNAYEKQYFQTVASGQATEVELTQAFLMLSKMLDEHHGIPPIIMIDEYDVPIQQGYMQGYYEQAISFMRNLFSGGLKDNVHVSFGLVTGILHVAKESIFSGLNNLHVNTVLDERYSEYFGFTSNEVRKLTEYYEVPEKYEEICEWYDGYRFGEKDIFNPWSVIGYLNNRCKAKTFWVSTSSNDIIGDILSKATDDIWSGLYNLMRGENVLTQINTDVIYPQLRNNPQSIYSFLVVSGYLKIVKCDKLEDGKHIYEVAIPNKEISTIYSDEILARFADIIPSSFSDEIVRAIYENDVETLQNRLSQLLLQTISYHDAASEGFYQGFVLGLCAMLDKKYYVTSNRESGEGRFDIQLMPRIKENPGILMELKSVKKCTDRKLDELAKRALKQMEMRQYDTEMKRQGVRNIIKYGVAFCGKKIKLVSDWTSC